jgi:hypothetical protein
MNSQSQGPYHITVDPIVNWKGSCVDIVKRKLGKSKKWGKKQHMHASVAENICGATLKRVNYNINNAAIFLELHVLDNIDETWITDPHVSPYIGGLIKEE